VGAFQRKCGIQTEREIGQTIHTMNRLGFSFRLVVLRWKPKQKDLFSEEYCYHCIATDLECSAEQVVHCYNERANIELVIRELKNGFGMDWMPTGDYGANSFWFSLGVLAYNSFIIQKVFIFPQFKDKTVQSIRWLFYEVAGKVVEHARKLYFLKLPIENYVLDYFVILTLSQSPELMRRVSEGEESHPFSPNRFFN